MKSHVFCGDFPARDAGGAGAHRLDVCAPGGWLDVRAHGVAGSAATLTVATQAGSHVVTVDNAGDFQPGHGVLVSDNATCTEGLVWRAPVQAGWQTDMPVRPLESLYHAVPSVHDYGQIDQHYRCSENLTEPLAGAVALRGYDGSLGPVAVFYLEMDGGAPLTFRWSDDVARTWKTRSVPVTGDWQPLSAGVEIRFLNSAWSLGDAILFDMRDQLVSRIDKIEGKRITLSHPATRTVARAVMRHEDSAALQAAVNTAIHAGHNVFLPAGQYRLLKGIAVINPAQLRIEGANAEATLLDMTEGVGSGFWLFRGDDVVIRNLGMVGHTGMREGAPYHWRSVQGRNIWRTHCLRPARAVEIRGTRRVLVENVNVRRIACECFYSQGPAPAGAVREDHPVHTEELTFLRCSVTDVGFNAFNNNDTEEGTSVLYCRMVDVGNCAWEGPARFIKFIGNYMRNCGACAIGNISRRVAGLCELGCAQAVFADNVFEGANSNRVAIHVSVAATQVIIKNNLFVNFGATAISIGARRHGGRAFPVRNVVVTGNIIDLTCRDGHPIQRAGIEVGASDTIVSDNQIYVRGACDPMVRGILLLEPAQNITVHNNLIRNCREGITTAAETGRVGLVVDARTFETEGNEIPMEWPHTHAYRGWRLLWADHGQDVAHMAGCESVIDCFDPETCRFVLREPYAMCVGDSFEVVAPAFNWNIHDNIIEGCARPVTRGGHGGAASRFRDNIIQCGDDACTGTEAARVRTPPPVWRVPRLDTPVKLDGDMEKWSWDDPARTIALDRTATGHVPPGWRVRACAVWRDAGLMLAVRVESDAPLSLRNDIARGDWGKGDGIGIVWRTDGPDQRGPIFQFWGVFDGVCRVMPTPAADAAKPVPTLDYITRASDNGWTAEIRLPLPLLGVTPPGRNRLRMNLGVRSSQLDDWWLWAPAGCGIHYGYLPENPDRAGWVLLDTVGLLPKVSF